MPLYRLLLRSSTATFTTATSLLRALSHFSLSPTTTTTTTPQFHSPLTRSFAFSSAEEAAAERRKRKRRLRIEPPLHAIQYNRNPPPRDPNAPRLPDSTSALVGPRLNIHNRVQSLIRAFDLDAASHVARTAVYGRVRPTVFTCNAIIAAMYRAKRYNDAVALFKYFFEQSDIVPNVVSYNNLINTHCDEGRVDMGIEVYRHIIANAPFSPSAVTYRHLTKGLIDSGRIDDAVDLLREMLNKGQGADSLVYNNVIKGFLDLGNFERANEFFDELKERCLVYDGVVSATFMDWWFKQGKDKEAMESYKSLMDKKFRMVPATCNVLLEVLLKYGKEDVAWTLFEQMLDNHTPPTFQAVNSDTFNIMVNHLFKEGKIAEAVETFKKAGTKPGSKPFAMDVAGYNNIITRFCEKEMLTEAEQFFAELSSKSLTPDVTSFRTLIETHLKMDRIDDALRLFDRMVNAGLWVVASFGTRVFNEFIKNGKVMESADILLKMANVEKEPKPDASLYDIVVRGLCDVSEFEKSKEILDQMMRYDIGVPPALKEFVTEAFGKVGKNEEIKKFFDENRWASTSAYSHMPQVNRRYSQIEREQTLRPFQTVGSGQSQMASEEPLRQLEIGNQAPSGAPQMTWTHSSGFQGMPGQHQAEQQQSGNYQTGGQQQLWNNQMGGQQPSWNSQMGGQKPGFQGMPGQQQSGHRQTVGQQSGNYRTGGQHQSWNNQMGRQQSGNYQTGGQHQSWNNQMGGEQSGNYQTGGQQRSWNNQMGGQQPSWNSPARGQNPSWNTQMGEQQPSWNAQMGGQKPSWNTQMGGQQPSWNTQVGGPQPSWNTQVGGQMPSNSTQIGGQQQQPSWFSQGGGHQSVGPGQAEGQQQSWTSRMREQQTFGNNYSSGNVTSKSSLSTGQGSSSVAGNNRIGLSGMDKGQPSQSHQNGGEQVSHVGAQQQMSGQLPFRSFQNAGQQSSSMVGRHNTGPFPVTGQYQWRNDQQQIHQESRLQQNRPEEIAGQNSTGPLEWQHDNQQVAV